MGENEPALMACLENDPRVTNLQWNGPAVCRTAVFMRKFKCFIDE